MYGVLWCTMEKITALGNGWICGFRARFDVALYEDTQPILDYEYLHFSLLIWHFRGGDQWKNLLALLDIGVLVSHRLLSTQR